MKYFVVIERVYAALSGVKKNVVLLYSSSKAHLKGTIVLIWRNDKIFGCS